MSGVWHPELFIKSSQEYWLIVVDIMLINAEQFSIHNLFINTKMMIQTSLCAPTNIERGVYVFFTPIHNCYELIPIVNLFKRHQLYRSTCDNQAIKKLIFNFVKGTIKCIQIFFVYIFRFSRCCMQ